jgi:hypothetical protein
MMYNRRHLTIARFIMMCPAEVWDLVRRGGHLALAILGNYR